MLLAALLISLASKLIVRGVRTYSSETAEQQAEAAGSPAAADGNGSNSDSVPSESAVLGPLLYGHYRI